ncbi:MAG: hypothetical protein ACLFUH_09810 [Bacteroidales bacterium]
MILFSLVLIGGIGLAANYTVTFEETNQLEGVDIDINNETITTNSTGEATIELEEDDYNYTATKDYYDDETGSITVDGAELTETFTMSESEYTVTFKEEDELEDVEIEIDGQTLTTDSNGEATIDLTHDTYEYTATKDNYNEETGSITVEEDMTESFEMTVDGYLVKYSTNDIKPVIIDVIVKPIVVLADIIEPYIWVIVAGIMLSMLFGFIGYFRKAL